MSEPTQGPATVTVFTPQMAYEVWRDSERDEAEGETRWHLLADEINKRLTAPVAPCERDAKPVDTDALTELADWCQKMIDASPCCDSCDAQWRRRRRAIIAAITGTDASARDAARGTITEAMVEAAYRLIEANQTARRLMGRVDAKEILDAALRARDGGEG